MAVACARSSAMSMTTFRVPTLEFPAVGNVAIAGLRSWSHSRYITIAIVHLTWLLRRVMGSALQPSASLFSTSTREEAYRKAVVSMD